MPNRKTERIRHLLGKAVSSGGKEITVRIRIDSSNDFFNNFDPAPVERRRINPELEDYLTKWLSGKPSKGQVTIDISLSKDFPHSEEEVKSALRNHFERRAKKTLRAHFREKAKWAIYFLFGLIFLAACLFGSHIFHSNAADYPFMKVLGQSLSIIGWVAIWEPASYFIYQRAKDFSEALALSRLAAAKIQTAKDKD